MRKLFISFLIVLALISFSQAHTAFFVSAEIFPPVYGVGGSYWWGTDLGFDVPDLGPIVFGTPQIYYGPEVFMVTSLGIFGLKIGVSGQFLLPIESLSFKISDITIQPAFAVNGAIDYWVISSYFSESLLDISISPTIVFMTKPKSPGEPKYYGWIWPYPLIIAFGMYR
ncbi:MAG: hypothetical protein H0Z24_05200 [Thermosipho sp. (in: Bacteria)]|nr:hypothetical protein [Thermosipho sp. (in: thermotogales)]